MTNSGAIWLFAPDTRAVRLEGVCLSASLIAMCLAHSGFVKRGSDPPFTFQRRKLRSNAGSHVVRKLKATAAKFSVVNSVVKSDTGWFHVAGFLRGL